MFKECWGRLEMTAQKIVLEFDQSTKFNNQTCNININTTKIFHINIIIRSTLLPSSLEQHLRILQIQLISFAVAVIITAVFIESVRSVTGSEEVPVRDPSTLGNKKPPEERKCFFSSCCIQYCKDKNLYLSEKDRCDTHYIAHCNFFKCDCRCMSWRRRLHDSGFDKPISIIRWLY